MNDPQGPCPQSSPRCGNETNSAKPGTQRAPRPPGVVAETSFRERQIEDGGVSDHQCEQQKLMFRLRSLHLSIQVSPIPDSLEGTETHSNFQEAGPSSPAHPREWLALPGTLLSCLIPSTPQTTGPQPGATETQGPYSGCNTWASSCTPSIVCRLNERYVEPWASPL